MSWLLKEENISYLAKEQNKFPTIKLSPEKRKEFLKNHKHPYIEVFMDLAESKTAYHFPHLSFSSFLSFKYFSKNPTIIGEKLLKLSTEYLD